MSHPAPVYLRPTAPIAAEALLPGDPGRALALAQELLERPRMANHHRGLWGYSGRTSAGRELTIQSTGIGGPSAAVVLAELAEHGVRRAIRLGTCTAAAAGPRLGAAIAAERALAMEGSSRRSGAPGAIEPDERLHRHLLTAGGELAPAVIASVDVAHPGRGEGAAGPPDGADAVDMGTATLFALGRRLGVAVAAALVVAATEPRGERLGDDALERASLRIGAAAARALAQPPS